MSQQFARQGVGSLVIDNLLFLFSHGNRTGCRFLTVDAYAEATPFYERQGFRYFTHQDEADNTRLMFFDLKDFV